MKYFEPREIRRDQSRSGMHVVQEIPHDGAVIVE